MTKDISIHCKSDDHTEGLIDDLGMAAVENEDVKIMIAGHTYYVTVEQINVGPGRPIIEGA
jgi:hypothetical protein